MDLTNLDFLKVILKQYGLWAKKGLGQNFLVDRNVLNKILEAADLKKEDNLIEIGPGPGVLTRELARRVSMVYSVEKDDRMIGVLKATIAEFDNVHIFNDDILNFDIPAIKYKLVANIPYYLTGKILRRFLEETDNKPEIMVLLTQKEVAEKIWAKDGNLNLLAISVRVFGEPKIVHLVKKDAFYPVPKVESAILKIDLFDKPKVEGDLKKFFRMVRFGFSNRRKMIRKSLAAGLHLEPTEVAVKLKELGIDDKLRAENLSLEDWKLISSNFC